MEEKKTIKISLNTIFILIALIVIIIMAIVLVKIYKQHEEQVNMNNELKEEINALKNNVNNTLTNSVIVENTEDISENNFTDFEIKEVLENYLTLIGYKNGYVPSILVPLNLITEEEIGNIEANESSANIETDIEYMQFKEKILDYVSIDFFDNNFKEYFISKNNMLYIKNVEGSGDNYNVKNISKVSDNNYKAEIENDAYEEIISSTINFNVARNNNGKCVINECDIK